MAYQKETAMRVWLIRISHSALTQKIDISDSKAVIRYVERPYPTSSFRVTSVSAHKTVVPECGCDACLDPYLADRISRPTLIQRIDISDSRTVVGSVERSYKTLSFRVVRVSTHKMAYRKETAVLVLRHNSRS